MVPLLLCMYFVTMEVSQAIETNKKVSRIGSMVADLVTQQQTTTRAELDAIMKIGQSLLTPYYRSKPTIIITAIEITDDADAEGQGVLVAQAGKRRCPALALRRARSPPSRRH